ncbi:hypothetical protein N9W28_01250 [Alphaproteobacteria bacterium]|jgi:hypothetical protein|nr:hypothetical protein [Alphaproteobacteria bacterium]
MAEKPNPQEEKELDQLIEKFKTDDEYFAHIQRQTVSHILRNKLKEEKTAEDRLIEMVINSRY